MFNQCTRRTACAIQLTHYNSVGPQGGAGTLVKFVNLKKLLPMEIRLAIEINQLIGLIRQLPVDHKFKIIREVEKQLEEHTISEHDNDLTELLLNGPVMTKDEELNFDKFNKEFERWTKNLSA